VIRKVPTKGTKSKEGAALKPETMKIARLVEHLGGNDLIAVEGFIRGLMVSKWCKGVCTPRARKPAISDGTASPGSQPMLGVVVDLVARRNGVQP
jgi:hypothetical protein